MNKQSRNHRVTDELLAMFIAIGGLLFLVIYILIIYMMGSS